MTRRIKTAAAALILATTLTGTLATGSAQAEVVPNVCGGKLTDYVGASNLVLPDEPFVGKLTLTNGTVVDMTVTPVFLTANVLRVEIGTGDSGRVKSGNFSLAVDASGRGQINFSVVDGAASSTNVNCESSSLTPTRVTQLIGEIKFKDDPTKSKFVVSRT
ncbi:hypothetical protein OG389_03435 [Streptomyces sp. NBC_00435]|uniref:hypothetical protein n=1 Tax=Streptomyces sp. NBC_00435 TaxID=2903649 RepID=UPI002E1C21F5